MPDALEAYLDTHDGRVVIRQAREPDAAALRQLRIEALASHPEAFAADLAAALAETSEKWVERLAGQASEANGAIFVAVADTCLIGMTGIHPGHWPKTAHAAEIWGVYVAPAYRNLGIGNALLNIAIEWARQRGIVVVRLGVITSNQAAIRCYTKAGFQVYGTEPKSICWQGKYYDEFLLSRDV